jgi:hypothetical protein
MYLCMQVKAEKKVNIYFLLIFDFYSVSQLVFSSSLHKLCTVILFYFCEGEEYGI